MREVGIARGAFLGAMGLHGVDVSAVEQRLVRLRIVAQNSLDELVLPHHGPPLPWRTAAGCDGCILPPRWRSAVATNEPRRLCSAPPIGIPLALPPAVGAAVRRRLGRGHA